MKRFYLIADRAQRLKAQRGRCITKFCRTRVSARRPGFYCPKCRQRRWREKNPLQNAYANLRSHAAERGKPFTISFPYFRRLAVRGGYVEGLAGPHGLSVDRKRDELGYVPGNLRVIPFSHNVIKENRMRRVRRTWLKEETDRPF